MFLEGRNWPGFLIENGKSSDKTFVGAHYFLFDSHNDVTALLPPKYEAHVREILASGGDVIGSEWSEWTPEAAFLVMSYQLFQAWHPERVNDTRLPPSQPAVMSFPDLGLPRIGQR